jgi:hypothetical protein
LVLYIIHEDSTKSLNTNKRVISSENKYYKVSYCGGWKLIIYTRMCLHGEAWGEDSVAALGTLLQLWDGARSFYGYGPMAKKKKFIGAK